MVSNIDISRKLFARLRLFNLCRRRALRDSSLVPFSLSLSLSGIVNTFAIVLKLPRTMNVCTTMRAIICLVALIISIICDDRRIPGDSSLYITHSLSVTRVRRSFLEDLELRSGLSILFYTCVPRWRTGEGENDGKGRGKQWLYISNPTYLYPSNYVPTYLPASVGKVRGHKTALLPRRAKLVRLITQPRRIRDILSTCRRAIYRGDLICQRDHAIASIAMDTRPLRYRN